MIRRSRDIKPCLYVSVFDIKSYLYAINSINNIAAIKNSQYKKINILKFHQIKFYLFIFL